MEDAPIHIPNTLTMQQARELSNRSVINRIRQEAEQEGRGHDGSHSSRPKPATPPQGGSPRPCSAPPARLPFCPGRSGEGSPVGQPGAEPPSSSSAAAAGTSLDTLETSVRDDVESFLNAKPDAPHDSTPRLNVTDPGSKFRHSGWWNQRRRIWESLNRLHVPDSRLRSFGDCGAASWIERSDIDPSRFRLRNACCRDRFCTPCANARSHRISDAVATLLDKNGMSFITLTLCGKGESLRDLLDRLFKHFRALRLHPLWDENVVGGAAFIEIKWSDKAQRWHPHLHIVARAKFIDQAELSAVWRGISKDSFIVDIRRIKDPQQVGHYVTKYASKPLNPTFGNTPHLLDEAIEALKGRRLVMCFGTWYGTALADMEDGELADDLIDVGPWSFYAGLSDVLDEANQGDPAAHALLVSLDAETRWRASLTVE